MPRGKKNGAAAASKPAAAGHNSNGALNDDEAADLTVYYQLKILEGQRVVDKLAIDMKSARDVVNGHFKRMTADLKFTRKDFEAEVISKLNMTEAEYLAAEKKRHRMHRLVGLRQGEQGDLLDHVLKDTVDDEIEAEANGYRAGRRGDDPTPKNVAPIMLQAWMRGFQKGQDENGERFIRAQEIIAARAVKKPVLVAEPESQAHEIDPETQIKEDADRLANSGWMEPTAGEAQFEDAAA